MPPPAPIPIPRKAGISLTTVYLIRHAEAFGNRARVFQGHTDGDISENGVTQLEHLRARFTNVPYDAIYASPLRRAMRTAQAANGKNLPIHTLAALQEIHAGEWEGCPFADLPVKFPEAFDAWENRPACFASPGGETMREVYDRIWGAMTQIVRENPGRTALAVSHGCAIRNLLCRAHGWPLERLDDVPWCDNTAVALLRFDEAMGCEVVYENDASHLSQDISTLASQDWWRRKGRG